ncbi:endonuclease/exonuclease/phosphatase family protein [Pseudoxanthomonas sp.]|uniref:endonuclease/exonuclease/phosphatase family protein n=1 Tax=Pseudoxanthomonas sp. TaxID=1871049 RepID=UPI003F7D42F9
MRRLAVLLLLLFAGLAGVTATAADNAAAPLKVMTFNVRLPTDADGDNRWQARKDILVDTIRAQQPAVFGTQELFAEQGDYIVRHLPQYAWFGVGRRGDAEGAGDEHMGVFYLRDELKVIESGDFWLSDTPDVAGSITWGNLYPRMVTWALFERIADGRRFYFFNTHLPYRDQDEPIRERGAALLLQRLSALPANVPVVVTGDFNTGPDSGVHARLTGDLIDAWERSRQRSGQEATFHAFSGKADRRIDWILVRGFDVGPVATVTDQQNGRYPSDHFPVVAELRWPAKP